MKVKKQKGKNLGEERTGRKEGKINGKKLFIACVSLRQRPSIYRKKYVGGWTRVGYLWEYQLSSDSFFTSKQTC